MAEVVASMTVTISSDWSNWMKGIDGSEQWRKLLNSFCNERCIDVVHDDNVIHLSGNFEAIKDVRRFLQDEATHASEKREKEKEEKEKEEKEKEEKEKEEKEKERIKIYERSPSISPTTGLEEKCEQMKIAGPEGTEKREDAKPKRVRTLKVATVSIEGEKSTDVIGSDDVGSDTSHHHNSSTNLTNMPRNQNQSTEFQVCDDKLLSLDEKMTMETEQPRTNYLDSELNNELTPDNFQMPQIHKSPHQGQMQESIYPPLSPDKFSANAGQMVRPIYTPSDQGRTERCSYPSQVQSAGHQGQLRQQDYTSQAQGQVVGNQAPTNHLVYPSQGHGQTTDHKGQMEEQSHLPEGQGEATGHQGPTGNFSYPPQGQGQATVLKGQTEPQHYLQGQATGHQGQATVHYSCPSQGQGQGTGHQSQTAQQSYPSQGQGQVAQHHVQIQQPSYSPQGHVTNHQGILQPVVNPINPGQTQTSHPSPLSFLYKQFLIAHAGNGSLYFKSNRAYNVLNISVHMGNIVDQRTQVLVSSANCQLTIHGSVSEAILNAAGQSVVDECSQIITSHGPLPFGTVIPTMAGNLGPHVEAILHAIIPAPQEFQMNPQWAFNLLIQVFLNALCMSSGQTKSVSFPAIGSEIFGIQRMVEAFTYGLREFDQRASSWPAFFIPGEIHLISNDLNKLKTIVEALHSLVAIA